MRKLEIAPELLTKGARALKTGSTAQGERKKVSAAGGKEGPESARPGSHDGKERYFTLMLKAQETHSVALNPAALREGGEDQPVMTVRFGILPQVETMVYFDMEWLDGHVLVSGICPRGA